MAYTVSITDTTTGEMREVVMDHTWESNWRFWWNEGNGACDCNRHLAFHGWPDFEDGDEFDIPCGHGRYEVKLLTTT